MPGVADERKLKTMSRSGNAQEKSRRIKAGGRGREVKRRNKM